MKLDALFRRAGIAAGALESAPDIARVTEDSRRACPGALFVATPGAHFDGHDFAEQAVAAGAAAIAGPRRGIAELAGVPYAHVEAPRRDAALLAHALAGWPTREMTVIGVTGTNGKTSTVALLRGVLERCGLPAASFGTLGYVIGGERAAAKHTTPFGEDLAEVFATARQAGTRYAVMEVSSHAIDQERIAGIEFDAAAFTNLTQDHLDYHEDMSGYRSAKIKLFKRIEGEGRFTVVNQDDPSAEAFIRASAVRCLTYGQRGDVRAEDIRTGLNGTEYALETPWGRERVRQRLLGRHNVSNALCAIAVAGGLGLPLGDVVRGIEGAPSAPGRFERVDEGQGFQVVVDYAHTDDGLWNVLKAAREMCSGRVLVVFGCGGDRDRTKRPKMAAVAGELADFSIITSDNPRSEEPLRIMKDAEAGMKALGKREGADYLMIENRAEAIAKGVEMARDGDLLMIAGKGHEDYQIIGERRIHFDDREVARNVLKEGRS